MRTALALLSLLTTLSVAHAAPANLELSDGSTPSTDATRPATPSATPASSVKLAFAVNPPVRWLTEDKAFAASGYVAFDAHQAIRANVAHYPYGAPAVIEALAGGEGGYDGSVTDVGASYLYFPRRAFSGFVFEAGALYRTTEGVYHGPFWDDTTESTRFVGARALIGWSWLFTDTVFASLQVGAAVGHRGGTETLCTDECKYDPPMVTKIDEMTLTPEGMMRIGVAFDL